MLERGVARRRAGQMSGVKCVREEAWWAARIIEGAGRDGAGALRGRRAVEGKGGNAGKGGG